MLFSMQNDLVRLVKMDSDLFSTVWSGASFLVMAIFFAVMVWSALSKQSGVIYDVVIVLLVAITIFLLRLTCLTYGESNPDESQWLATVITLKNNPYQYFKDFYIYDFSRSLTVLPIWLLSLPGLEVDFGLVKTTGILFAILCVTTYYFFVKDVFDKQTALVSTAISTAYIATFFKPDYISYNSEIPSATFLLLFLFFFYRSVLAGESKVYPLAAGVLAVCALFAKEQSAYIVFSCGLFCFIYALLSRRYTQIACFVGGGFCAGLVFMTPFVLFHLTGEFLTWLHQISDYINYHSQGHTLRAKMYFLYIENNFIYYLIPLVLSVLLLLLPSVRRHLLLLVKNKIGIFMLLVIFYVSSLYTVLLPEYFFMHYSVFLIMPSALVLSFLVYLMKGLPDNRVLAVFCALMFLLIAKPCFDEIKNELEWRRKTETMVVQKSELSKVILRHAQPGEKMIVWGWDCLLFVDTGLVRASRYWYTWFLNPMYPEEFRARVIAHYEDDFVKYQPALVVELINKGWIKFPESIEEYPSIKRIIDNNYVLVEQADKYKIYKLKNNQAPFFTGMINP